MQVRFDRDAYHDRCQVETVVSMLKRRQGSHTSGRSHHSRCRDLYLMVLTHNAMILILLRVFYRAFLTPFSFRVLLDGLPTLPIPGSILAATFIQVRNMPFDSKSVAEVQSVLGIVAEPDREMFNQLARSPSFEIRALLYGKIVDKRPPFAFLDAAEVDSFCINFLLESFKNNSRSVNDYSRIEYRAGKRLWIWLSGSRHF